MSIEMFHSSLESALPQDPSIHASRLLREADAGSCIRDQELAAWQAWYDED